jgi:hypothetical protein
VSLLSKKAPVDDSLTGQAMMAARQAMNATTNAAQQAAQQGAPLARNAGTSVKQGTNSAIAWATPYAEAARQWAAPRLEQSAHAVSDSIAPKISDALMSAANKIDVQPKPRHRLMKVAIVGLSMLLTAGAAVVLSMRRQQPGDGNLGMPAPGADESMPGDGSRDEGDYPEGNGQRIV